MRSSSGRRVVLSSVAAVALIVLGVASASTMPGAKTRWRASRAALPANAAAAPNQDVVIRSISCASPGNCSAVGAYADSSGIQHGLLLTERAGKWRAGLEVVLPAHAGPGAYLDSVSCASGGNCTAVGDYGGDVGAGGLLLSEKSGRWTTGVTAPVPANARIGPFGPIVHLSSVSCASAGNCSAVGNYEDSSGDLQGLLLTEKAGRWRTGVEATLPANAAAGAVVDLSSVSCASAGNCTAVGYYNGDYYGGEGLLLTEKAGRWRRGVEATLPPNKDAGYPEVSLTSVSCASAGNCSAVGTYNNDYYDLNGSSNDAVLLTETAGRWAKGIRAKLPANSVSRYEADHQPALRAVSCAAAGDCTAVGWYVDNSKIEQGLLLSESGDKWRTGVEAAPRSAGGSNLYAVSCAAPGDCTATGDGGLVTEKAGKWGKTVRPPLPAQGVASGPFISVSCSAVLSCSAVGQYGSSDNEGLLLDNWCGVPELRGKSLSAARRSIAFHGCAVGKIEYAASQTIEKGHVISQRPEARRRLDPGAKVSLEVSRGR